MIIGQLIKEKRIKLKLNQKELSDKLNISIQRLNNFENSERTPSLSFLGELSKILDFDIDHPKRKNKNIYNFSIDLFHEKLSKYRKDKNYSLEQLGNIINISRQTLSKWEKGESYPNINDYYKLCRKLKIKPSLLICDKIENENTNYPLFILGILIPLIICLVILINSLDKSILNNRNSSSITNISSSNLLPTTSSNNKNSILDNSLLMNDNTVLFINEWMDAFNNTYKDDKERPYTIHFNDPNIEDINFYYGEEIFLPMYFGDNNFIEAYHITENELINVGFQIMYFEHDINLTPSYTTYDEYLLSINYIKNDDIIFIDRIHNFNFFIIPDKLDNISNFKVNNFYNLPMIFISNYSSILYFDGINMDEIPRNIFINSKSIEFTNCDLNAEEINVLAIKQHENYDKSSNFISCHNIRYLYIDSDKVYDKFIYIKGNIENIILKNYANEYMINFFILEENNQKAIKRVKKLKC